jgi:hypothetical protein
MTPDRDCGFAAGDRSGLGGRWRSRGGYAGPARLECNRLAGCRHRYLPGALAFIGFENMANIAEEPRDPERSIPSAILISLGLSTVLYAAVASVAVLNCGLTRSHPRRCLCW